MGLCLFPSSTFEVAALPSEMGSFYSRFVEYKEQNGFAFANFRLHPAWPVSLDPPARLG
jgi:hypothetical protein